MKNEESGNQKLSQKKWFIILWLVLFFPVGLFFMWKSGWNKVVKIIISSIIAVGIVSSLISPSKEQAVEKSTVVSVPTVETTASVSTETQNSNQLLNCPINISDVKNGTGTETIGKWANIKVDKKELEKLEQEKFVEFVNTKIEGSGYNWFTIIFEDGTGIQFNGSVKQIATYGKIDTDGCITESLGNILLKSDNTYEYSEIEASPETTVASATTVEAQSSTINTTVEETTKTAKIEMNIGQKNALRKAASYLDFSAFSHSGLVEQLEYEQFSTDDATFAVDNCGADWNEQAAKKAASYLEFSSFSRSGLIDQLKYEGFTSEQAEYGVSAVGY